MLIYNDYCDILNCEIAKIHRSNGRYDAPKISMGKRTENVVKKIRTFTQEAPEKVFYLLWFGLDSLTPVFWLIAEGSIDYYALNTYCNFSNMKSQRIVVLDRGNLIFANVLQCVQSKMEIATIKLQTDLEQSVEMETDNPKFKDVDIKKAKKHIYEVGRLGEQLINDYLDKKKFEKQVLEYEWINKTGEKGRPFDFYIKYQNGLEQWVDVKATEHDFNENVIVSKNEIKFITDRTKQNEYAIYRVYSIIDTIAKLRICSECLKYIKKLYRDVDYMTQSMHDYQASLFSYKISFTPGSVSFNSISDEIILDRSNSNLSMQES